MAKFIIDSRGHDDNPARPKNNDHTVDLAYFSANPTLQLPAPTRAEWSHVGKATGAAITAMTTLSVTIDTNHINYVAGSATADITSATVVGYFLRIVHNSGVARTRKITAWSSPSAGVYELTWATTTDELAGIGA